MSGLNCGPPEAARLAAICDDLTHVSTATASSLAYGLRWRNTSMQGHWSPRPLGL